MANNNEEYWRQMSMRRHDDPLYAVAVGELQRIQHERDMAQRGAQFMANLRQQASEGAARREAAQFSHADQVALAKQKMGETQAYREAQMGATAEARKGRESVGWLNFAQNPDLDTLYGPEKAATIKKYALNQYFNSLQREGGAVPQGAPPAAAGAGGVEGLTGGQPANPRAVAVRNQLQNAGQKVTPQTAQTTTNAPASVPQRGNVAGVPQQVAARTETPQQQTNFAPSTLGPERMNAPYGVTIRNPQAPSGYDLNPNTGEYVRSDVQGTVNGRTFAEANQDRVNRRLSQGAGVGRATPDEVRRYNADVIDRQSGQFGGQRGFPAGPVTRVGEQPKSGGLIAQTGGQPAEGEQEIPSMPILPRTSAPTEAGQLSRWSFQPLIGQTAGGAVDKMFGIGSPQAPSVVPPQNAMTDPWGFTAAQRPIKPPPPPPEEIARRKREEE